MKKLITILLFICLSLMLCMVAFATKGDISDAIDAEVFQEEMTAQSGVENYDALIQYFSSATNERADTDIAAFPDYYGGAYVNGNGQLVVLVTDMDKSTATVSFMNLRTSNCVFELCKYSQNYLDACMKQVASYMRENDTPLTKNVRSLTLRSDRNDILVTLRECNDTRIEEFRNTICDSSSIVFEENPRQDGVLYISRDNDNETYAYANDVNLGEKIWHDNLNHSASIGYRAIKNGIVGFVTAGHFIDDGEDVSYGSIIIGNCASSITAGYDGAFVEGTNSRFPISNVLHGTGSTLSPSVSYAVVGATINKIGATTGLTTGTVVSTSHYDYFDGYLNEDVVQTNLRASFGDSGGVVYIIKNGIRTPLGIILGMDLSGYTCFTKASNLNRYFGISCY